MKYLNLSTVSFFLDFFYVSADQRKESTPPDMNLLHYFGNKNYKRGTTVVA